MSFNPMMGSTIARIRKLLPQIPTVIELGSQTLKLQVKDQPDIQAVPEFYSYDSIDFNNQETINRDLNKQIELDQTYDLVTNNGTGEHNPPWKSRF